MIDRVSPLNGDARFPERPTLTGYDAAKRRSKRQVSGTDWTPFMREAETREC